MGKQVRKTVPVVGGPLDGQQAEIVDSGGDVQDETGVDAQTHDPQNLGPTAAARVRRNDERDAKRYRQVRDRGLIRADWIFAFEERQIGPGHVSGEMADAFVDADIERYKDR